MGSIGNYEFEHLDIKKQLYELLKNGFKELQTLKGSKYKISVFRRDPIVQGGSKGLGKEIPCVSINRLGDGESDQFIGEVSEGVDEDGHYTTGRFFSEVFELRVWSTSAGMRDDIYIDMKKLIMAGKKDYLEDPGAYIIRFLSGVDEADHNFLPGIPMFWGTMQVSVINSLFLTSKEPIEKIESFEIDAD